MSHGGHSQLDREPEGGAALHALGHLGHGQHGVPHDLGHLPRRLPDISGIPSEFTVYVYKFYHFK